MRELTTAEKWASVDRILACVDSKQRKGNIPLTDFEEYIKYNFGKSSVMSRK
jgi:hypothetical protein